LWFAPHSALTSEYAPFYTGSQQALPVGYTNNNLNDLNRNVSAYWAFRYLYQVVEIKSYLSLRYDVRNAQREAQQHSLNLVDYIDANVLTVQEITNMLNDNARKIVSNFWSLSDTIVMRYADGWCNFGCPEGISREIGYEQEWLDTII